MMSSILQFFILVPLLGFFISLVVPSKNERLISRTAFLTVGITLAGFQLFLMYWFWLGAPVLNLEEIVVYRTEGFVFLIDFYFDNVTAVFLFVGSLLTFLVTVYSRYYLHREHGYKRFFNTVLFFYFGYTLTIFSGNFETLFVGWEILGVSSFLLIAFYRDRYLPVKNAVKVFSIYRTGDVGILLAMWMSHHLFHENISFLKLSNYDLVSDYLQGHSWIGIFISLMIVLAAAAKSAQLPFSTWLPRAMEGPTPSSAIFYGSLAVHMGVFLLLRTFPFWEHQVSVRIIIGLLGLSTSVLTTGMARVQSSVKSQIAYASIAQIGIIFMEVAAGLEYLALVHFAGNAFLRTYQLLVSPSVVSYQIREQFYTFVPRKGNVEDSLPRKLEYAFYMMCLKEWNLDSFMYRFLWNPVKWTGKKLGFVNTPRVLLFFIPAYLAGLLSYAYSSYLPDEVIRFFPILFSIIGLASVLKSFTERVYARMGWVLVITNHFWIALAISMNESYSMSHTLVYLSGISVFGVIGYLALQRLKNLEGVIDLNQFHGHVYKHPKIGLVFLISSLAVSGFPITPSFIGEDLIFMHIHEDQFVLAFITALSFIIDGLAIIRIYARTFLGPHVKSVYDMAYRSS
jgi:NADH-quinone oxidoreductase subunit L